MPGAQHDSSEILHANIDQSRHLSVQAMQAEEILVPMVTWDLDGRCLNVDADDVQQSLQAIREFSVFQVMCRACICIHACESNFVVYLLCFGKQLTPENSEIGHALADESVCEMQDQWCFKYVACMLAVQLLLTDHCMFLQPSALIMLFKYATHSHTNVLCSASCGQTLTVKIACHRWLPAAIQARLICRKRQAC